MGNRRSLIVAITFLVVLAGCSAPIGDSPASNDHMDPIPSDVEVTDTDAGEVTFPPGVGPDGVTNASALVSAHHEATRNRTYRERAVLTPNRTAGQQPIDVSMQSAIVNGTEVQYVEKRGQYVRDTYTQGSLRATDLAPTPEYDDPPFTNASWSHYVLEFAEDDADPQFPMSSGPYFVLYQGLRRGDFEYVGTTERNGTTLLVFGGRTPTTSGPKTLSRPQKNTKEFDGYLLVSQSGVVHRLEGSYRLEPRNTTFSYELRFTDDRPPKPDWVAELPRPRLEDAGDRAVAFRNTGGAAVPENAVLEVRVRGEGEDLNLVARNLSVPERIPPGEAAYLSVVETDDGRQIRITADRPTDGTLVDLTGSTWGVFGLHDIRVTGVRITVGNETGG